MQLFRGEGSDNLCHLPPSKAGKVETRTVRVNAAEDKLDFQRREYFSRF